MLYRVAALTQINLPSVRLEIFAARVIKDQSILGLYDSNATGKT
jgi:hypothetical protein